MSVAAIEFDGDDLPHGGRVSALASGLVGSRFYGDLRNLEETGERD
jgi:hypothetical protein